jgi:anti-sigma factor RsiW
MRETVANSELCLLVDGDLSGNLPVGRRKRLEARVAAAPQAAARLALWRRNDAVLRLAALDEPPGPGVAGLDAKDSGAKDSGAKHSRPKDLGAKHTADRIAAPPIRLAQPDDPIRASDLGQDLDAGPRTMANAAGKAGFAFMGGAACGAVALATLLLAGWS